MSQRNTMKIFTGNAHRKLARNICHHLKVPLGKAFVGKFPDGEVKVQISRKREGM